MNILFNEARKYIAGGVNSPVRAFKSVGKTPLFIKSAKGKYLFSEAGEKYLDFCLSWGPMNLGHANPVGAFGGKKEIMDMLAPEGNVYQAGTLSGNPIAMSAGIARWKFCRC